jgi:hypothetical protein
MSEKWNQRYPGDEVVLKAIWSVLEDAAKEKGMTLDEACRKAYKGEKPGHLRRAIGLNVKNQRGKVGLSLQQVSKRSGVPVRRITLIERGAVDAEFLEWVRIAYALRIKPSKLAESQEAIEKNLLDNTS